MKKLVLIGVLFALWAGQGFAAVTSQSVPPTDFFVRWKRGTPAAKMEELYRKTGMRSVWRSRLVWGLERLAPSQPGVEALSRISAFGRDPSVLYAQPNFRVRRRIAPAQGVAVPRGGTQAAPNDPLFSRQWALQAGEGIKIEQAWEITHGNANVRVAVIDTGVDGTHPELSGQLALGYDFIDKTPDVSDHGGHGSHVAGIIGARTNNSEGIAGINPAITIIPIRAVPSSGDETDANVIEAFEFAVSQGARVANCSFGKAESSRAVGDVINAAGQKGLLVVVAAGNSSEDLNRAPSFPASFQTPNMIVVAATRSSGGLAGFSNYGVGKVDIGAPGASIISSVPHGRYASYDGTSMAAPHVTGVAALVLSANPKLSPLQLKEVILRSAEKEQALQGRVTTGARLDAAAAVRMAAQLRR